MTGAATAAAPVMLRRNLSVRRRMAQMGNRMLPPIARQTYFHLAVVACFVLMVVASLAYVATPAGRGAMATLDGKHLFAGGGGGNNEQQTAAVDMLRLGREAAGGRPVAVSVTARSSRSRSSSDKEVQLKQQPFMLYPAKVELGADSMVDT